MKRLFAMMCLAGALAGPSLAQELRVMSFNVRYPNEQDGANYWDHRRDIAVRVVLSRDPDIFGTQELFRRQGDELARELPEYKWFGRSRRGNDTDEHMGVFYKPGVLELIEEGDFWLSETPEKAGSISWDMSLPRMVTWGLFRWRSGGGRFYFLNTHFPHRREDAAARVRCAEVIVKFLATLPAEIPVVMTGDFNDPAGEKAHRLLTGQMRDAWDVSPGRSGPVGTFHGFSGEPRAAQRIDWILHRGPWRALLAETVTYAEDGRYPSDHFPVFAVFRLARQAATRRQAACRETP